MGKPLGSWGGMRKYLETEMLADSLKKRVKYSCTKFAGMDGAGIFAIYVDNKPIKNFSMETVASHAYSGEKPVDMTEYWDAYWDVKNNILLEKREEFDDEEFSEALTEYRTLDIINALHSQNPIIRMFAVLDRRVGKRALKNLADSVIEQPEWLRFFYNLRIDADRWK